MKVIYDMTYKRKNGIFINFYNCTDKVIVQKVKLRVDELLEREEFGCTDVGVTKRSELFDEESD